ncbi:MAG: hypothetical protein EAX91_15670 [Candidatus Lokiarchaeota archaeon]|nr:hypothetical protein [Candidatus Lokiarchaeota archaeon]
MINRKEKVLKIEIETVPIQTKLSTTMETQTTRVEPKPSFKKIHYMMFVFVFLQVLWYFTFSEPLTELIGGQPIFPFVLSDDVISRTARLVMIYHSLAIPFLVANTFWILEHYPIRKKWLPTLKVLLVPSAFLVGINGMIFAYTRIRLFHELFIFGLFLCFIGGVIFVISAWPVKGRFPKSNPDGSTFRGLNLEYFNLVVLAICILVSTIYGALAAIENFTSTIWGLNRDPVAFLAEAIVRHGITFGTEHDIVENMIIGHLHIQLAQSAAMVMLVGFRTSKMSGNLYKFVLLMTPIGIITLSYGAWVLNHYVIWVGAGILILGTLTMAIIGLKNTIKTRMKESYNSASRSAKLKNLFKEPVKLSYYYLFLVAQFIVFPQIYAGLTTDSVYRLHSYVELEYGFNVGHWHQLAVSIAVILMLHAIDYFKVEGKLKVFLGWTFFIGVNLTFPFAMIYMVRPLAWEYGFIFLDITFVGIWVLLVGFVVGLFALAKNLKKPPFESKQLLPIEPIK